MSSESEPTVFVVDDDAAIRLAMQALLDSVDLANAVFASGKDFLENVPSDRPGCLILDIRMPGLSGLEMQLELKRHGYSLPIIFITGHGDVPMAVAAMQNGALDFVQKPFRDQVLLDSISRALDTDRKSRDKLEKHVVFDERIGLLTNREREVFDLVVTGKPNKIIAYELGVSQRTVEIHRSRVMDKMQAHSLAELVKMHLQS